jgi:hypothetical protein
VSTDGFINSFICLSPKTVILFIIVLGGEKVISTRHFMDSRDNFLLTGKVIHF